MTFAPLPETAAWRHLDARTGFEVVRFHGRRIEGCTTAVEDGLAWIVDYVIDVDATWATRRARITGRTASRTRRTLVEADGAGRWRVDGAPAPHLDGCLDIDLESSAMTNTFPVHRLGLAEGAGSAAPAAFVRALDLGIERLDQHYARVPDEGGRRCYDYAAPVFGVTCRLVFDASGLVLDYPGLAVRER
ncbi:MULTISPECIES: putative glycolipid-binding domain-containing protein [unclassified Nonomuraea]|uniref:putative glycolipid-binding domain-containing protein n=1 Tax=unclassified Nonomuraea TaxID=2593643 RepID=UPI0035BFC771